MPEQGPSGVRVAEVVEWGGVTPDGVFGVGVECPNGCREGYPPRYSKRPLVHWHGWPTDATEWGGERSAHCGVQLTHAPAYELHWTDMPDDVRRKLRERERRMR